MRPKIQTVMESGGESVLVDVECHLSNSLPNIIIVGIASKSVDEAKERIRGGFANSNIKLPKKRITLNLAPADLPKEGSSFDLPIVAAILQAGELTTQSVPVQTVILGEVGLDGSVRPIRGIIGKIIAARKLGVKNFWIPAENMKQAKLIPNINLLPINSIGQLYKILNSGLAIKTLPSSDGNIDPLRKNPATEDRFGEIIGQKLAKRALLIAVAGQHNIMLNGPPGAGKSMLAKALSSIMPPMTQEEMLEVTQLHSLAGKNFDKIITARPIRSPHHSSSHISIIGGGQNPKPGEISLSHKGILFFDEFPEFARSSIEALRQPLEDRKITVARAKSSIDFPANFILVATSNPCPCGYYGSKRECNCSAAEINKYQKRISGPVIDRIDLYITVDEVPHNKLLAKRPNKGSETKEMANKVIVARDIQRQRAGKLNSELTNKELRKHATLDEKTKNLFDRAAESMQLSSRGYMRALKVARTIADLDGYKDIETNQITEALQYRKKDLLL